MAYRRPTPPPPRCPHLPIHYLISLSTLGVLGLSLDGTLPNLLLTVPKERGTLRLLLLEVPSILASRLCSTKDLEKFPGKFKECDRWQFPFFLLLLNAVATLNRGFREYFFIISSSIFWSGAVRSFLPNGDTSTKLFQVLCCFLKGQLFVTWQPMVVIYSTVRGLSIWHLTYLIIRLR